MLLLMMARRWTNEYLEGWLFFFNTLALKRSYKDVILMSQVMEIIFKPGGGQTQFAERKLHLLNQAFQSN